MRSRSRKKKKSAPPSARQLSIEAKPPSIALIFHPLFCVFGLIRSWITSISICTCSRRKKRPRATRCEGSVAAGRMSKRVEAAESIDARSKKQELFLQFPLHTRDSSCWWKDCKARGAGFHSLTSSGMVEKAFNERDKGKNE